ncbi:hypothetical protein BLD48_10075 [Exiguobacterium sp. KRL4]|uniref:hypothetical protein n=1 Tax=Exiguobacterium sp. KRL4 TaxID=1914536 RepID=UPI0008F8DBC2|nr:hypothetical protein [Exiguobacterium sp. KRL4]OIN66652.1 hypothetical protein BLD48_10075 [Exiguobacterium sp. KRL4]
MRRNSFLLLMSLLTFLMMSGCSNEEYVIEEIHGNQFSLGPDEQNPEEQYALTEVTIDNQTTVDGKVNPLSALQKGDVIRFEYRNDKKPLVATIERVK